MDVDLNQSVGVIPVLVLLPDDVVRCTGDLLHADPIAVIVVALSVHLAVDAVNGVDLSGRFVSAVELG